MSLVLGTLKPTSRALAGAIIHPNALCSVLMFVLYDVDAADSAMASTYNRDRPFGI